MFERFQQDARAVIANARKEAARAGRRAIGTEHLLLGLLTRPGPAAEALKAHNADAEELRARIPHGDALPPDVAPAEEELADVALIDAAIAEAAQAPADADGAAETAVLGDSADSVRLTRNARRALDLALRASQRFKQQHVSSEHMLLALIEQPESQAVEQLKVAGIHVGTLRTDVLRQITGEPDAGTTRRVDHPRAAQAVRQPESGKP
jgi:ATP-dependent Clp protease ATP-binding subunit ClpA